MAANPGGGGNANGYQINLDVQFSFNPIITKGDLDALYGTVKTALDERFKEPMEVNITKLKLNMNSAAATQTVNTLRNALAKRIGKMGHTPITLENAKIKFAESSISNASTTLKNQLQKALGKGNTINLQGVKVNLAGMKVNTGSLGQVLNASGVTGAVQQQVSQQVSQMVNQIVTGVQSMVKQLGNLTNTKNIQQKIPNLSTLVDKNGVKLNNASHSDLKQAFQQELNVVKQAKASLKTQLADFSKLKVGTPEYAQAVNDISNAISTLETKVQELNKIFNANNSLKNWGGVDLSQDISTMNTALSSVKQQFADAQTTATSAAAGIAKTAQQSQIAKDAILQLSSAMNAYKKAAEYFTKSSQSSIGAKQAAEYRNYAKQYQSAGDAHMNNYQKMVNSGLYSKVSSADHKQLLGLEKAALTDIKNVTSASNNASQALDKLRTKYASLKQEVAQAMQAVSQFNTAQSQQTMKELQKIYNGIDKTQKSGNFTQNKLNTLQTAASNQIYGLNGVKQQQASAKNLEAQFKSSVANVKSYATQIQELTKAMSAEVPGTSAFQALDTQIQQLKNDIGPAIQQMDQFYKKLQQVHGLNLDPKFNKLFTEGLTSAAKSDASFSKMSDSVKQAEQNLKNLERAMNSINLGKQHYNKAMAEMPGSQAQIDYLDKAAKAYQAYEQHMARFNKENPLGLQKGTAGYEQQLAVLKAVNAEASKLSSSLAKANNSGSTGVAKLQQQYERLLRTMQSFSNRNPKLQNTQVGERLQSIISQTQGDLANGQISVGGLNAVRAEFDAIQKSARGARLESRTFGENMKSIGNTLGGYFSGYMVTMQVVQQLKEMIQYTRELDTAMTELKKVTDYSGATYDKFLDTAASKAVELGGTLTDVVTSTGDFARLGYDLNDALKLAESAITLKNVGDGIESISDASEKIISTMKAFNIAAESSGDIVDKYNEVGNNYAISSSGIAEALQRSASALAQANNDINQSIGLAVG